MEWIQTWIDWFGYILRESWEFPAIPGWMWVTLMVAWMGLLCRSHDQDHIHYEVRGRPFDR